MHVDLRDEKILRDEKAICDGSSASPPEERCEHRLATGFW
jgi:hypothetical protein